MASNAVDLLNVNDDRFSIKSIMDGCHLFQCKEVTQFQAIIFHQLELFLDAHPKVRSLLTCYLLIWNNYNI
jgi:hypothetical protein